MIKRYLLLYGFLLLIPYPAFAHGSAIVVASPADVALACGGETLVALDGGAKKGSIRWMKATGANGSTSAIVGLERVKTTHGYFVQATCIAPASGSITSVTLMRAMPDEAPVLRDTAKKAEWWRKAPEQKNAGNPLVSAFYRSVLSVEKAYGKLPANLR
ncbi:hypothetical protein MNBD_NITROSPINAE01-1216 [hydrothermal vent metagenome]|uniref:Uncharacterized protein n=1 Tax=hydrothermal vent metagenome TaxID=652676 RepID=A0A3B1C1T1_9ZZZZ